MWSMPLPGLSPKKRIGCRSGRLFSERLSRIWKQSVGRGKGPHLFHFGNRTWQGLREWGELAGDADRLSFLWNTGRFHHTDLRRLMLEHFYFPSPGRCTIFALSRILGFASPAGADTTNNGINVHAQPPDSLFHDDPEPAILPEEWEQDERLREDSIRHVELFLELQSRIWKWAQIHLESEIEQTAWDDRPGCGDALAAPYLHFLEEERRLREEDILALQEYPLPERIERFRAIGPLTFLGTSLDEEGRFLYGFQAPPGSALSRFREDDFLKLAPTGSWDLQSGFPVILARYHHGEDRLSVLSRQGRLALSKRLAYSLEEDLTDWNHPKLVHIVGTALSNEREHRCARLLSGDWTMSREREKLFWIRNWLRTYEPVSGLNSSQLAALELPFRKRLALIEGPPGTGKTHLLGWIIIALILEAQQSGEPLRIAVSALTHRAIDGVLQKVADLLNRHQIRDFPGRVLKWGRWKEEEPGGWERDERDERERDEPAGFEVQPLNDPEAIQQSRYLVLGATGFGLYNLFHGETGAFSPVFDWIVFDEASQILVPQALLSLVYGQGRYLFLGDVKQLPPVVRGSTARPQQERATSLLSPEWTDQSVSSPRLNPYDEARQSILAQLLDRYDGEHRVMLDQTYRMNEELCAFPSKMWYGGALHAAAGNAHSRLELSSVPSQPLSERAGPGSSDRSIHQPTHQPICRIPHEPTQQESDLLIKILAPEKPVALVLADHRGCHQKSDLEAEIVARLASRLMVEHGMSPDRLALISPHRAQNNAVAVRLRDLLGDSDVHLPVIDTVERLQGAERDVILFAITTSDPDHVMSEFLNNPNRFNVAITRARQKLIVVGSRAFFLAVPQDEEALQANRCFKEFFQFCREHGSLFIWKEPDGSLG